MNDALTRFFDSINFKPSDEESFKSVLIEKVVLNKKDESFSVHLNAPSLINLKDIKKLISCASKGINGDKKCRIVFSYESVTDEDINNYIGELINNLAKKRPSLTSLQNSSIEKDGEIIIIEVTSKIEESEINKEAKKISAELKSYGLPEFIITTRLNADKRDEIVQEIKKSKEEIKLEDVKVEEDNLIYGKHRDGEITLINDVKTNVDNNLKEMENLNDGNEK